MATETKNVQGTTLEVLAPYLPYGVEVEVTADPGNWYGGRGPLFRLGWPYNEKLSPMAIVSLPQNKAAVVPISHMLPVLKPFNALCHPLPDGTIPAVALAYMIFGGMVGDGDEVHAGFDHFGNVVVAAGAVRVMSITPDWLFCPEDGNHAGPAEYRKLLEWHFAVGLEPSQFIEAGAAVSPTIEKEKKS
jgi:hypothetical protein